jgi:hypothetical protein
LWQGCTALCKRASIRWRIIQPNLCRRSGVEVRACVTLGKPLLCLFWINAAIDLDEFTRGREMLRASSVAAGGNSNGRRT